MGGCMYWEMNNKETRTQIRTETVQYRERARGGKAYAYAFLHQGEDIYGNGNDDGKI